MTRIEIAAMCDEVADLIREANDRSLKAAGLIIYLRSELQNLAEAGEGDVSDCDVTIDAYDRGYQAGLQATQPRKVEVTDSMIDADAIYRLTDKHFNDDDHAPFVAAMVNLLNRTNGGDA